MVGLKKFFQKPFARRGRTVFGLAVLMSAYISLTLAGFFGNSDTAAPPGEDDISVDVEGDPDINCLGGDMILIAMVTKDGKPLQDVTVTFTPGGADITGKDGAASVIYTTGTVGENKVAEAKITYEGKEHSGTTFYTVVDRPGVSLKTNINADPAGLHRHAGADAGKNLISDGGYVHFDLQWENDPPEQIKVDWQVNGATVSTGQSGYIWNVPQVSCEERVETFTITVVVEFCGHEIILEEEVELRVYPDEDCCDVESGCEEIAGCDLLGKAPPAYSGLSAGGGAFQPLTGSADYTPAVPGPPALPAIGENVRLRPRRAGTFHARLEEIMPPQGEGGGQLMLLGGDVQTLRGQTVLRRDWGYVEVAGSRPEPRPAAMLSAAGEGNNDNGQPQTAKVTGHFLHSFGRNLMINYADLLVEDKEEGTVYLTLADVGQTGVFEKINDEYLLVERTRSAVWDDAHLEKKQEGHFVYTLAGGARRVFAVWAEEYDIQRIDRREDPNGNAVTFTYDPETGALAAITDASGNEYEFTYNEEHYVEEIYLPAIDATWSYTYTEEGRLASETDSRTGRTVHFRYDEDGSYIGAENEWGDHSVEYDPQTGSHTVNSPTSDFARYKILADDPEEYVTEAADRNEHVITARFDRAQNVRTITFQDGSQRIDVFDEARRLVRQERLDPDGPDLVRSWTYDENDYIASETIDPGGLNITTGYVRDSAGRVIERTDPAGNTTTYGYDEAGNLTGETDPLGNTTAYTYDEHGLRTSRTDPEGNAWTYTYDAFGNRTATTCPEGNTRQTEYDAYGRRTAEIDPLGNRTEYEYDAEGNLIKITGPLGHETTYEYDSRGLKTKVTNARGVVTTMTYNERGQVTEVKGQEGEGGGGSGCAGCPSTSVGFEAGTYSYDAMGSLIEFVDAMNRSTQHHYDAVRNRTATIRDATDKAWTTTFEYDALGRIIKTEDSRGGVIEYEYDGAGRRVKTKVHIGEDVAVTQQQYDPTGRVVSMTDPLGNTTTFSYDDAGRQVSVTVDPGGLGLTTVRSYDDAGRLTGVTVDPGGLDLTTAYEYYDDGSLKKQTDPEGNTVEYAYDAAGRQVAVTDQNGETTHYAYDAAGRMTETTDPRGNTTSYEYDEVGNRTLVTDAAGSETQYEYSPDNHLEMIIDSDGYITSFELNADGTHASMTDKLGRTTHYEYDGLGRRVKTTDPKNNTVEKEYDGEGNLLWVEDQNGNRTEYSYDQAGRRVEEKFADNKSKTFAYNLAGYLTGETDQNGSVINNTFDAAGRLVQRDVTRAPGVAGTTLQSFTYDAAGRMTSSTDNNDPADPGSAVQTARTYDAVGRVVQETVNGYAVVSTYQGTRRTVIEYPGGTVVTMSHDAAGNMISVHRGQQLASSFTYDANNLVESQTLGNNVELANERDTLYRITKREYHKNQTLIAGYSYDYDGMGNKLYQEDLRVAADSELYAYDDLYRLTSWERGELNAEKDAIPNPLTDQSWNLNPVGNWDETSHGGVTETRQHNVVNELVHRDNALTTALVYCDSGNLIEDHEHEYVYDVFNRLVQVVRKSDSQTIATYRYDTQNRRVVRVVENSGDLDGTTQYVYDGWQVVEERDGAGQLEREYTYGNYIDEPITLTVGNDTYYYHTNNLYHVRALTDENGAVVERYRYSAYGKVTMLDPNDQEISESAVGNVYMFQGRRYDPETSLYYYRNRMMSAKLGRFLQRDPLGYVDGWNLYAYVGNNPILYGDPLGKFAVSPNSGLYCREETYKVLSPVYKPPHLYWLEGGHAAVSRFSLWVKKEQKYSRTPPASIFVRQYVTPGAF